MNNEGMTDLQFTKLLNFLEKSIEEIIKESENKEDAIKKIKELLHK